MTFTSGGATLVGTLDLPDRAAITGVLIVSGGNEVRAGAHRGMAMLAADLAAGGLAVFRFDRAGVGDSAGGNAGYAGSRSDILAAAAALKRASGIELVVGIGNCDAASALALFARECGVDAVIATNPWLGDEPDALPPPAAIRARYREGLVSSDSWRRLLSGEVSLRKLMAGLAKLLRPARSRNIAERVLRGISDWGEDAAVVLAKGDATALAFAAAARKSPWPFRTYEIDTASHGFAGADARAALARIVRQETARLVEIFDRLEENGWA